FARTFSPGRRPARAASSWRREATRGCAPPPSACGGRGTPSPSFAGARGGEPEHDPRLQRVANHLRSRRPDKIRDGVHALEIASEPLNFGAGLVALGEADGCLGGALCATADVIRAALWAIGTAPGVALVSSS